MDLKENTSPERQIISRHPWERVRASIVCFLLRKYLKKKDASLRVLDAGSGDLYQATVLLQEHPNVSVVGVDTSYSEDFIEKTNKPETVSRLRIANDWSGIRDEKEFDWVLLMDVLEHIEDDTGFLTSLVERNYVGDDTLFFITVPAHASLFSYHDTFLGHYRRYDRKMLGEVCKKAGLEKQRSGYLFFSLWIARKIQFLLLKTRKIKKAPASDLGEWKGSSYLAGIITLALRTDFLFAWFLGSLGIRLTGLSAFYLGKKGAISRH